MKKITASVTLGVYRLIGPKMSTRLVSVWNAFFNLVFPARRTKLIRYQTRLGFVMETTPNLATITGLRHLGIINPIESQFVIENLRPGDVFVDVGAFQGWYSLLASQLVGQNGRVLAVEPNPETIRVLHQNIALNAMTNVDVVEEAISEQSSFVRLKLDADQSRITSDAVDGIVVRTRRLDSLLASSGVRNVRCLKVDTEGSELEVLKSAGTFITHHRIEFILFEHLQKSTGEKVDLSTVPDPGPFLEQCGYREIGFINKQTFLEQRRSKQLQNRLFSIQK